MSERGAFETRDIAYLADQVRKGAATLKPGRDYGLYLLVIDLESLAISSISDIDRHCLGQLLTQAAARIERDAPDAAIKPGSDA